jgi:signal transduction histidine kinase/ActR/RegA family two-component response regulator
MDHLRRWARLVPSRTISILLRLANLRLRTKLILSFAFLTAALTCVTLLVVRHNAEAQVEKEIERDGRNAILTFQVVQRQQQTALSRKAELLASLAAMRNGDATAIKDASEDPWQSEDCNLFVLAGKTGEIVAVHSTNSSFPPAQAQQFVSRSVLRGETSGWWFSGTDLFQVVIQPFYEGEQGKKKNLLGVVVVGHLIGDRLATDLGRTTSTDMMFRYGGKVTVSTFPPLKEAELAKQLQVSSETPQVFLNDESYHVASLELTPGVQPAIDILVLKSYKEAEAYLKRLNRLLLGLGLAAILVGGTLVYFISNTVTSPLGSLVQGVQALERGDFTYPLEFSGHDELSNLTRAFDGMRATLRREETQREQLEGQLRQVQKMEALGRLAGGVAHDFNNLLTVIRGHSDLLMDRLTPGDVLYGNSAQIQKTADRAASLTRQMLAFSRMQMLRPTVLDINELIVDMGKLLRRLIREDIEFSTRLGESLARVKADPGQIEQVLLNLTVNASDAMPVGGQLTIETQNLIVNKDYAQTRPSVDLGAYVLLSVTDTGQGMDDTTKARMFEPFFTTKEPGKGTGLGLATVYGIVRQSGGFIWVDSHPGKGTRFEIYLPRTTEQQESIPRAANGDGNGHGDKRKTVLIVEDEKEVRDLACEFLKAEGYRVLTAEDGIEALETAKRMGKSLHVVLTDIVMPRMRGSVLAEQLKNLLPSVRIVFMTGYLEQNSDGSKFLDGAFFLQKPFSRASLVAQIDKALKTSQPAPASRLSQTTVV